MTSPVDIRPAPNAPSSTRSTRSAARAANVTLGVILICQMMVVLDATVVTVALPEIRDTLGFSQTGLSWVQNSYALTFGGLLLLGARAGDLLGRRRMLMTGIAIFSVASLAGGLANSEAWLLTSRAIQGIGAAIASPATLALLTSRFPEGPARLRAMGLFSAVSAGGASIGLVAGGMLTEWASWRWALLINVPIGIALLVLAPRYIVETPRQTGRFDIAGAITSTTGMSTLVYGFVEAADRGWADPVTLASFGIGLALMALFVRVELTASQPITPLHLLTHKVRGAALAGRLFMVAGMYGMFFFLTQYLSNVLEFSPLQIGFAFVPMSGTIFTTSRILPKYLNRLGAERVMVAGALLLLTSMLWLTRISPASVYWSDILPPVVLFGLGAGASFLPMTTLALEGVKPAEAGAASGLVNVVQQMGGALGLSILVTVFGTASRNESRHVLPGLSGLARQQHDLAAAVATSFTASALFAGATLAVVLFAVRNRIVANRIPAVALAYDEVIDAH
jgi:EmrB/QacA subfamily drug resistance transporter